MDIKRLTITIEGVDDHALELAAEEVTRLLSQGFTSGFNSNESGAFNFSTETVDELELAWTPSEEGDADDEDCTCRPRQARSNDIDPPEGRVLDRDCPVHGRDPDADRESQRDDAE